MIAFGTEIKCTAFVLFAISVPIAAVIAGTIIDLIGVRAVLKLLDKIRDVKEFGD
jgi:hypothetical protein